jgi:hypothetical protein
MSDAAHVTAISALADFKAAFSTFKKEGQDALVAADMEAQRAQDWLDQQQQFWKREVRDAQDDVAQAKNELARKKMFTEAGRPPDTTEEERVLRRALHRLEEAEAKVEACRRWGPVLQREIDEYNGPTHRLAGFLEGGMPRALALLERMIAALEGYVALAPSAEPDPAATPSPPEAPKETAS